MYRVAHNVASQHIRKAKRTPHLASQERTIQEKIDASPRPDEAVACADARTRLRACIEQLRVLDRQIILLFLEDVPQTEIALITGLTQANVSTRVHRIKGELMQMMKP